MKVNDAITGGFFLALAIAVFLYSGTFRTMPGVAYGPDLFPRIIAGMMGLGGAILIASGLRQMRLKPVVELADWARNPRSYVLFAAVTGGMLFYYFFAPMLGFTLAAAILLLALLLVTRGFEHALASTIITIVITAATYLLFVRMLRVTLPFGVIESWLVGLK